MKKLLAIFILFFAVNTYAITVNLAWDAPTNSVITIVGYNLYRSEDNGTTFVKINTAPVTGLTYADTAAVANKKYIYAAKSVSDAGTESDYSNKVNASIPLPPGNLRITISASSPIAQQTYPLNSVVPVVLTADGSVSTTLFIDGIQVAQVAGTDITYNWTPTRIGSHNVRIVARTGTGITVTQNYSFRVKA